MRPIATDVARSVVCVCVLGIRVSSAIAVEPIEMPPHRGFESVMHCDLFVDSGAI